MKRAHRNYLIYLAMLLVLGSLIFGALKTGEYHATNFAPGLGESFFSEGFGAFLAVLRENLRHPLAVLLVQILVILVVARGCAALFRFIGQPGVIGEIIAGIVLGPSLLGWLAPEAYTSLFRPESLGILEQVSNIGLLLFMFVIGLEVDFSTLRSKMNATIVISHGGIFSSFFLGILASLFLYEQYAAETSAFLPFALFERRNHIVGGHIGNIFPVVPVGEHVAYSRFARQSERGEFAVARYPQLRAVLVGEGEGRAQRSILEHDFAVVVAADIGFELAYRRFLNII